MKLSIPLTLFAAAASVEAAALANPEANPQWCLLKGQSCWKNKRNIETRAAEPQWCLLKGQSCWKDKRDVETREAEPQWCLLKGQSCWKVKRVAEALAEALQSTEGAVMAREAEYSNQPGHASFMAKRQVDELALVVAAATGNPDAYYNSLGLGHHFNADTSDTSGTEKRDVDERQWCPLKGQSCWKRDVEIREPEPQWCLLKGQSCWKDKRSAEEQLAERQWCLLKGQSCWKAKRLAEAVVNAIETVPNPRAVPFDPDARVKRSPEPWNAIKAEQRDASAEAACNAPSGACTKAKRDLHAIYNVARDMLDKE